MFLLIAFTSPSSKVGEAVSGAINIKNAEIPNLGPLISKIRTELQETLKVYDNALRVKPDSYASKVARDPQLLKVPYIPVLYRRQVIYLKV